MKTAGKALLIGMVLIATSFVVLTNPAYASSSVNLVAPLDGISTVTADIVAANGQTITGTIDATGTDIAVYVAPGVSGVTVTATIYGATMAGVYADEGSSSVTVTGSTIYQIGAHDSSGDYTPNGAQYGFGVMFATGVTGAINGNTIYEYQKGGIVLQGGSTNVPIIDNIVTGNGPISYIAQNGIEVNNGATATISHDTVSENIYTGGDWSSTGILLWDAGNTLVNGNSVSSDDCGIWVINDGSVTATYQVSHNIVQSDTYDGILIYGATATVDHNIVLENVNSYLASLVSAGTASYTYYDTDFQYYADAGILLYDAGNTVVDHNILNYNDVGIWIYNDASMTATYSVSHNTIDNSNGYGIVFDGASGTSDHNVVQHSPVGLMATTEINYDNTVTSSHDSFNTDLTTTQVLADQSNTGYSATITSID